MANRQREDTKHYLIRVSIQLVSAIANRFHVTSSLISFSHKWPDNFFAFHSYTYVCNRNVNVSVGFVVPLFHRLNNNVHRFEFHMKNIIYTYFMCAVCAFKWHKIQVLSSELNMP